MNLLAAECPISFEKFVSETLYHPEFGYYAAEPRQVGKKGDYFTSVSVGSIFGEIVASHILAWWREQNHSEWQIIEPGANHAALANDILHFIKKHDARAYESLTYITVDALEKPRNYQKSILSAHHHQVLCVASPSEIPHTLPTFFLANEVLDALPFHIVKKSNNHWLEANAVRDPARETFEFSYAEITDDSLAKICSTLPELPENYLTEIRTNYAAFLSPYLEKISCGRLLFFDYGFAQAEYFHPARDHGTYRTFYKHQAAENPLENIGEQDITAHVNFSHVAEVAIALGCILENFEPQEFFLTKAAAPMIESLLSTPEKIHQFQTLTHPAHMGHKFHAIEFSLHEKSTHNRTARMRL